MKILIRIISLLILFGFFGLLVIGIPVAADIVSCYEKNTETFDDIEVRSRVRGWAESYRCQLHQGSLVSLETCIENRFEVPAAPVFIREQIFFVIQLVRPDVVSVAELKKTHNEECQSYPDVIFVIEEEN